MSSMINPGVYTIVAENAIPSTVSPLFGTIGLVGHMTSGLDSSGTEITGISKYDANALSGTVYEFNNITQALAVVGTIPEATTNWQSGIFGLDGDDTAPYDSLYNMIRALELIYLVNPSAKVKATILTGSGTSAAAMGSDTGVTTALAALRNHADISYLVLAGGNYNTVMKAEAVAASAAGYERMYIGGNSLNDIMTSGVWTPDLSAITALAESEGRSVAYITNVETTFGNDHATDRAVVREVGGNFLAAYLAGQLSTLSESTSLLTQGIGYAKQVFSGVEFLWSSGAQATLWSGYVVTPTKKSGTWKYGSGRANSTTSSFYKRITTRRIVDRVEVEKRAVGDSFIGFPNNLTTRNSLRTSLNNTMTTMHQTGLIGGTYTLSTFVNDGDIAAGIVRVQNTYSPVTEIEFIQITSQVSL